MVRLPFDNGLLFAGIIQLPAIEKNANGMKINLVYFGAIAPNRKHNIAPARAKYKTVIPETGVE